MEKLLIGMEKTLTFTVTEDMLAMNVGSGGLGVLATPALAALMEKAAFELAESGMDEGITTVGTRLVLDHLKASLPGAEITVTARLAEIDGRRYVFEISAADASGEIARCTHERFSVISQRFMEKLGG